MHPTRESMLAPALVLFLLAAVVLAAGCSGGGGSGSESAGDGSNPGATSPALVGVMEDVNSDGSLDLMDVSTETDPITVTRLLVGDGEGHFVEDPGARGEAALSREVSDAIFARMRSGTPPPEGIEVLHVQEDGVLRTLYLIFG